MELKELITLLGLPETATIEDVRKALTEALKKPSTDGNEVVANSTVLSLLSLNEDARTEDVVASIMALKAGNTDVAAELLELKNQLAEKEADELVNMALKDGKISAAQTEWAKQYALSDKKGFKSFMEKAPVVVNMEKWILKMPLIRKIRRILTWKSSRTWESVRKTIKSITSRRKSKL